jgi:Tfp pilus assembly protein FimT
MTKTIVHQARSERGVTLIDTVVVLAVMAIVGSMATMQMVTVRRAFQGDGAMRVVMAQLIGAREKAITERRNIEIQFVGESWLYIVRHEVPSGTTVLAKIALEDNVRYSLVGGVPDIPEDANGNEFAISFGTTPVIVFTPSGSLVDSAGAPLNGTVFLSIAKLPESYRAVSVLGAVGRVVGWRWNGHLWQRV